MDVDAAAIEPETWAKLLRLVDEGRLTAKSARELVPMLVEEGGDPEALMRERGLEAVSDAGLLESAVAEVLEAHPDAVDRFREGDEKIVHFLMGQVMGRTQGKANPAQVRQILAAKLEA